MIGYGLQPVSGVQPYLAIVKVLGILLFKGDHSIPR